VRRDRRGEVAVYLQLVEGRGAGNSRRRKDEGAVPSAET